MHSRLLVAFAIGLCAAGTANAQQGRVGAPGFDRGKYEYEAHCAVCHGLTGKGDGPFADLLKAGTVVSDLTTLSKKNNGVYPYKLVYDVIEGAERVRAHGPREMPVWGPLYRAEAGESVSDDLRVDREAFARARILALTEYISRLQAK